VDMVDSWLLGAGWGKGAHAQALENFGKARDLNHWVLLHNVKVPIDVDPVVGNHIVVLRVCRVDVQVGDGSGVKSVVDVVVVNGVVGVVEEGVKGRGTIGLVDHVITLGGGFGRGYIGGGSISGTLTVSNGIGPNS